MNLDELRRTVDKLRRLSGVSEDGLESWKQLDFERSRLRSELASAEQQRLANEERLQGINKEFAGVRARVTELEEQYRQVEEVLKPEMQKSLELLRTSWRHKSRASMWRIGAIASLGLLSISMVGTVIHLSMFFYAASVISLGLLAFSVSRLVRLRRTEWKVRENLEELRRLAKRFDLNIEGSEDLLNIQNPFERDLQAEQGKLREFDIARRSLGSQQFASDQKTGRNHERLQEVEDQIKGFALQSGIPGVGAYRVALETRRELNTRLKTLHALLSHELGPAKPEVMIDIWDTALEQRTASDPESDRELPYDPARVQKLEREIGKQQAVVAETDDALNLGRRELRDLELKIAQSGILRDRQIACRTTGDLKSLTEALRRFIGEIEFSADNAKAAIRLFELIEVEEKSRLVELFGAGKPVSRHFKTMTDGLYDEVRFDVATNEIGVLTTDNVLLSADCLSGGALDQLYLAIRIAIAERLAEEPGFFILDDPFIKADFRRVKTQMTVLKRLVQMGWQILYFSAKQEVVEILEDDIRSGQIELIQLDERLNPMPSTAHGGDKRRGATQSADLFSGD